MPGRPLVTMLILVAFVLCVSSCGNSQPPASTPLPPAADLMDKPEPAIPDAALEVGDDGKQTPAAREAEAGWNDEILLWGRAGWKQVARLCRWARGHGSPVECPPAE